MTDLAARLARRIATAGPITVADYMAAALGDFTEGYYRRALTPDEGPLGAGGDFVTAPEISQLFGELIGAWLIDCWDRLGRPKPVRLVELGPGRGVLMADALRIGRHVPQWLDAIELHLVEINPGLRQAQADRLKDYRPVWHESLATVPDGPILIVANEFLDALPVRQLVHHQGAWRERLVGWQAEGGFHYALSRGPSPLTLLVPPNLPPAAEGTIFEISPAAIAVVTDIARRVVRQGGAALLIDYGRAESTLGGTLQAVRAHKMVDVLRDPGRSDLSAHVDFGVLGRVAKEAGAAVHGPTTQGAFLTELGIKIRAERLKGGAPPDQALALEASVARLIEPSQMGTLFKVAAIATPALDVAGFGKPT